ncbi:hypothetical protein ACXX9E_28600 [Pseudomonas sp. GNP014]
MLFVNEAEHHSPGFVGRKLIAAAGIDGRKRAVKGFDLTGVRDSCGQAVAHDPEVNLLVLLEAPGMAAIHRRRNSSRSAWKRRARVGSIMAKSASSGQAPSPS